MRLAIAILCALAGSAAAEDVTSDLARLVGVKGGLTADQAAARARRIDPAVAARTAAVAEAEAERSRTRRELLPRLHLVARYTRLSPLEDSLIMIEGVPVAVPLPAALEEQWSFGVEARVPLSDYALRLGRASAARTGSLRAARWLRRAELRHAEATARRAYFDWARARLGLVVAEKAVELATAQRRLAARRAASAAATRADLLVADARLAQSERTLTQATGSADLAERRLRILTGDTGGPSYQIGEDVLAELERTAPGKADKLVAAARARRPEMRALDGAGEALAAQSALERARFLPRLDLVGNLARANPHPRQFPQQDRYQTAWDASVVLTFPLEDIAVGLAEKRAIAARQAAHSADRRRLADGIDLEVHAALDRVRRAEAAIRAARRVLDAAEEVYRVRARLYREGSATATDADDAEVELTRARFAWLDAHIDLRVAWVDLDLASGR
jgi:outer membrane protein